MNSVKFLALAMLAFASSGCASIVSDTESSTYIETDPEKARCELHGQDFKRVVETPSSIHLSADAAPITMACSADGYRTTTQPLDTEMDGWIFGNIIFGGVVGVVIDAARGAGQKYPPHVMVFLEPEVFTSEAARDEWFDRRRKTIEDQWQKKIQMVKSHCVDEITCRDKIKKVEKNMDKELDELEERRQRSPVAEGNPSAS